MLCTIIWIIFLLKFFTVLTKGRCKSKVCLTGKTALITGGYSGLGFETALNLASRGCRVIIADIMDLTATKEEIIRQTHNPNIVIKHVDLQSFKSVRALAKDLNETEPRLDILINNAGIASNKVIVTEDGLSKNLQINYFSHILLTHLLLDLLKKSSPSRIVFTSSALAFFTKNMTVAQLTDTKPYKSKQILNMGDYGIAKVLVAVATVALTKQLKASGVTVNCLHPGVVNTGIFNTAIAYDTNTFILRLCKIMSKLLGKNVEEGSQTIVYLACDEEVEGVSGKYFLDCCQFFHPWQVYNRKFCQEMWKETLRIIRLEEHEKLS